jgi:hypothetical protein
MSKFNSAGVIEDNDCTDLASLGAIPRPMLLYELFVLLLRLALCPSHSAKPSIKRRVPTGLPHLVSPEDHRHPWSESKALAGERSESVGDDLL